MLHGLHTKNRKVERDHTARPQLSDMGFLVGKSTIYGVFGGKKEQDLGNNHSESLLHAFLKNSVPDPIALNQYKALLLRNSRISVLMVT